ncbi:MAG: hypothetical protein GXY47_10100 [Acidobacteria bacterium]|nr:hypothetical protein [Acidobacteriota bacterium]
MKRTLFPLAALALGAAGVLAPPAPLAAEPSARYEVLSPWAEVDPVPLRGLSPRLDSLAGKKIGIFANYKRAALPVAEAIEKNLKTLHPDIQTVLFHSTEWNVTEVETADRETFTAWAKGVDAVVGVIGD